MARWPEITKDFETVSMSIRKRSSRLKEKSNANAIVSATPNRTPAAVLEALQKLTVSNPNAMDTRNSVEDTLPCHNIPAERSGRFRARAEELKEIQNILEPSRHQLCMKSVVIWGIAGIGKTQIALEYAHRAFQAGVQAVLWVNCETGLSISANFAARARLLQLKDAQLEDNSDLNRILVLKWLLRQSKTHAHSYTGLTNKVGEPWLLILDNVEDKALARQCWPTASHGAVLVTAIRQMVNVDSHRDIPDIPISRFSKQEGGELLRRQVGTY